jgi:UDP-glucose 4-epimerase
VLRYANVYWPRQNAHGEAGVISIFLDKIMTGKTPTIFWDGSQTRDFISVDDIISANIHALEKNITGIYHVWTGVETSVNQLWEILAHVSGTSLIPEYTTGLGELQRSALESEKLRTTGWRDTFSLEEGIIRMNEQHS